MNNAASGQSAASRVASRLGWAFVALVVIAVLVGGCLVYQAATTALDAEENLHATLFAVRLVEQFVYDNDRWPDSWPALESTAMPNQAPSPLNGELSVLRIGGQHGYEWPAAAAEIRRRVQIDFQADPTALADVDPSQFEAIKPIGPYFEYRYYGFVDSLQATLRKAIGVDRRPGTMIANDADALAARCTSLPVSTH